MKDTIIEMFYGRGLKDKQSIYRLIKSEDGRFQIRRDATTLLLYSEGRKAEEGFKTLRKKLA